MASGFNLTAQLNLRGPSNIGVIVADIRRQIGSINAAVNLRLDPNAIRNTTQLNASLQGLNRTLNQVTSSASNAAAAIGRLSNALGRVNAGGVAQNLGRVAASTNTIGQSMRDVSTRIVAASSEMQEFGKQSGLAVRRFAAFSTVTGVIYGLTNAINQGVKAYIDYDRQLVKLQQVTGQSAAGLKSLEDTITQLAVGLGVGSAELTQISSTLAQAGLSAKDTERALKALALSSLAPSFDSMNETVEGAIALMRQFGIGANQLEKALGSVNSVAAKFAVEASDLITAIQRTGGVFATASRGVSEGTDALNEFLAVFTSVRATTRESAETIATGLRTIFTRIQREDTINALKSYGVNLTDLDGKFVGAYNAVELLSKGLSKLDPRDLKFSRIVEELGGFRQIGKVIPLIQQFATAQEALKVAQSGQGSLAADAAKAQESLAIQTAKVKEEFLSLFREIGKSDSFQTLVKGALSVTSALIKTADSVKGVLPILGVMLAFKGASAITQFGSGFVQGIRGSGGARGLGQRLGGGSGMSNGGPVRYYASGGLVPGSGDTDSVSARLTPGEFVINKRAVKAIGTSNLNRINRYAVGGPVPIRQLASSTKGGSTIKKYRDTNSDIIQDIDLVSSAIDRKNLPLTDADKKYLFRATLADKGSGKRFKGSIAYLNKNVWGDAYEEIIAKKLGSGWQKTSSIKEMGPSYPLDLYNSSTGELAEVKFTDKPVSIAHILSKKLRQKLISSGRTKKTGWGFTQSVGENVNLGRATVYEPSENEKREFVNAYKTGALDAKASTGGIIRKFADAGLVSATGGKPVSASQIIRLLGAEGAAKAGNISANEVNRILRIRKPDAIEAMIQNNILKEYQKTINRREGAQKARGTRLTSQGLLFGVAGMFGSAFPPVIKTIESNLLKSPVSVKIMSGIMSESTAQSVDEMFASSLNKTANKAAKKIMVADILGKVGLGRELNLDFDRTLAFGADNILSDPKKPKFVEFSDRNKVSGALKTAKLSLLGRELASLVSSKPELLNNLRLITARPASTLDLIQSWLSSKGLPIPLSQFKGLGGPSVSGSQIAKLKAALLSPGSLFVDDDVRNIKAARRRSKEGIESYRYSNRRNTTNINGDATAQGILFEKVIEKLGGPLALKGGGLDFPEGLKGAAKYFGIPANIPTDAKRTINGPSTVEDNIITYLRTKGYATGGEANKNILAMLTPGELVLSPDLASSIGRSKLDKLNHAEKFIKKASGGTISMVPGSGDGDSYGPVPLEVGSYVIRKKAAQALGFNTGGYVQGFAVGGPTLSARPANPTVDNVRIDTNVVSLLQNVGKALTDLGLSSNSAALLLKKNADINYREAQRALEADVRRMRVAGASAQEILDVEARLANVRNSAASNIAARQTLSNTSGQQLQEIQFRAQREREDMINRRRSVARARGRSEDEINAAIADPNYQRFVNNRSFETATTAVTGVSARTLRSQNISGSDIEQVVRQSMMDRRTLAQMDRQYVSQRRQEIFNQLRAEAGVTATKSQIRVLASQALTMAQQEVKERRQILNQQAAAAGVIGPGRGGILGTGIGIGPWSNDPRQGAIYRTLSPMMGGITPRNIMGGIRNFGSSLGTGNAGFFLSMGIGAVAGQSENISSLMGGDKKAQRGRAAAIEGGLSTFASGLSLASGAAMIPVVGPFVAAATVAGSALLAFKDATNASAKALKEYEQEQRTKNIDDINDKINRASETFQKTGNSNELIKLSQQANGAINEDLLIKTRNAAEEKAKSQSTFSWLMGENKPILSSEDYKSLGKDAAKQAEQSAQSARMIIESRIQGGADLNQYGLTEEFAKLSNIIAQADPTFTTFIASTKNMTDAERAQAISVKLAERRLLLMRDAGLVATNSTVMASKAMEEANKAGRKLAQTFESMNRSFSQALGRTQYEAGVNLNNRESRSEDLTGSSRIMISSSRDLNIAENPLAYDSATRAQTYGRVAREIVRPDMAGLDLAERNRRANEANLISQTLNFDTVGVRNRTVGAVNAINNGGTTFEQASAASRTKLEQELANAPSSIRDQILKEFDDIINNIAKGDSKDKSNQDKIKILGETLQNDLGKSAIEAKDNLNQMALEFLKFKDSTLKQFVDSLNKVVQEQLKAAEAIRQARSIVIESRVALRELISGGSIGLGERAQIINNNVGSLTGGITDPTRIRQNIQNLSARKSELNNKLNDPSLSKEERDKAIVELEGLTLSLNKNRTALDELANSTELASAAMSQLQNLQKMQADRLQNIDQILTSTPQELRKFNESLIRVQQRAMGIDPGPSREARKAYNRTLRQTGGNVQAAMMAGQAQMAEDRGTDLRNMEQYRSTWILNQMNEARAQGIELSQEEANRRFNANAANVRGQMANESGAANMYGPGINEGIMASVDPMRDPAFAATARVAMAASDNQARAKEQQAILLTTNATEEFGNALKLLTDQMLLISQRFSLMQQQQGADLGLAPPPGQMRPPVIVPPLFPAQRNQPQRKALGGLIYAANGQFVDFKPMGTDTIPAMLTPGEFVVNRTATEKHLPLLTAINGGNEVRVDGMSSGGLVYLARGGRPGMNMMTNGGNRVDGRVPKRLAVRRDYATFSRLDADSSGYLTSTEIDDEILSRLDGNNDGRLSTVEFFGALPNTRDRRFLGRVDWRKPTIITRALEAQDISYRVFSENRYAKFADKYRDPSTIEQGLMVDPRRPKDPDAVIPKIDIPSLVPNDPRSRMTMDMQRSVNGNLIPIPKTLKEKDPKSLRNSFYRLDVNEDGVLSGTELTSYRDLDTDLNQQITEDEWLGVGFDPYDSLQRERFNITNPFGKGMDARRRALESGMAAYERSVATGEPIRDRKGNIVFDGTAESLKNKREELATIRAARGGKSQTQLIREQKYNDRLVNQRLGSSGYAVGKAQKQIDTEREMFEEERKKISNANPLMTEDEVIQATTDSLNKGGYTIGADVNWWKNERGITATAGQYDETRTLEAIKNSDALATNSDPTGAKARASIDAYAASQGARAQADRVSRGMGDEPISPDAAVVGTQGPVSSLNRAIDNAEVGRAVDTRVRREKQDQLAADIQADVARSAAMDKRDKELGIYTGDINRDIYVSGMGDVSYQPGMGSKISIEEQKQRRREKVIKDRLTFTDKTGKYSQSGTIDSIDAKTGTVRIAKIDPNTGAPVTKKDKDGIENQVYTTIPIDQLDTKSQAKINKALEKDRAQQAAVANATLDKAVQGISISAEVDLSLPSESTKAKADALAKETMERANADQARFDQSILPTSKPSIVIDPITRQPKTIDGQNIDVKAIRQRLEQDRQDLQAQIEDWVKNGQFGEGVARTQDMNLTQAKIDRSLQELADLENAKYEFDTAREEKNLATQKRYEELKKKSETGRGLASVKEADEFARLSIERGVAPGEIPGGRTVVVERAMRSEAFATSDKTDAFGQPVAVGNMEKQSTEQYTKDLVEEKRTSQYSKLTSEISNNASQSVENLTGSRYLGNTAGFVTTLGLGIVSPENVVTQVATGGLGLIPALGVDVASAGGGALGAYGAGDSQGVIEAAFQGATTLGMTGAFRALGAALPYIPAVKMPNLSFPYKSFGNGVQSLLDTADESLIRGIYGVDPKVYRRAENIAGIRADIQAAAEEEAFVNSVTDFMTGKNSPVVRAIKEADADFRSAPDRAAQQRKALDIKKQEATARLEQQKIDAQKAEQEFVDSQITDIRDRVIRDVEAAKQNGATASGIKAIEYRGKVELEEKGLLPRAEERLNLAQETRRKAEADQAIKEMQDSFNTTSAPIPSKPSPKKPKKLATGGIVYAANGALINAQQKGSDTVPAMLTPGEFVVNRQATQQHLPVLQAINKGYYSRGGMVQYLADGGIVAPKYYMFGGLSSGMGFLASSFNKGKDGALSDVDPAIIAEFGRAVQSLKDTFGSLENFKDVGENIKQAMSTMSQNVAMFGESINSIPQEVVHNMSATVMQHVMGLDGAEQKYAKQFDSKMEQVALNTVATARHRDAKLHEEDPATVGQIIGHQAGLV